MTYTENLVDKLLEQLKQELPFVVYRKPEVGGSQAGSEIRALLQNNRKKYLVEDFSESGFVLAPFDSRRETILIPTAHSQSWYTHWVTPFEESGAEVPPATPESDASFHKILRTTAKQDHMDLIRRGLAALQGDTLDKVVLARSESVVLSKPPLRLFGELARAYPNAFVYCWYHPDVGMWMGATPESLVHLQGTRYTTMALAGTQAFKGQTIVAWGEKELEEQQYVTDFILNNLRDLGLQPKIRPFHGAEKVSEAGTYTSRAGNLLHLRTDIEGELRAAGDFQKIVLALHPTPAVGGVPKETARSFILKEEPGDREFYTGFLGELNLVWERLRSKNRRNIENRAYRTLRRNSSLYVNLRCMKLEGALAKIYVGGGITIDSDPEAEWEETVNKAQTMKSVLG